jgi:prepilin-type N-terminal cleavage/methylation domain-containing protein
VLLRTANRGFSLIEGLVALLLIGIAITAFVSVMANAVLQGLSLDLLHQAGEILEGELSRRAAAGEEGCTGGMMYARNISVPYTLCTQRYTLSENSGRMRGTITYTLRGKEVTLTQWTPVALQ